MTVYVTTIKPIKRPGTILFVLLWDVVVFIRIIETGKLDKISLLFNLFGFLLTFIVLRQLFSKLDIIVYPDTFLVRKSIFNIAFQNRKYLISEMHEIKKVRNAAERTTWGFPGFHFTDKTPTIMTFKYKDKLIEVGLAFNWKNIDETLHEIKNAKRKSTTANK